ISAWIRPLVPLNFDEDDAVLRFSAPNRFKLDWVRKNFSGQIEHMATQWYGKPVRVAFELAIMQQGGQTRLVVPPVERPAEPLAPATPDTHYPSDGIPDSPLIPPAHEVAAGRALDRSRLDVELTFDNFVTGKANQLARAAALQVAENPGVSYNPLFLYGGGGLGETTLSHTIGNALVARLDNARVRYVHADQYVSDVVKAYQRKAFDDFKRYYHSLDLLLIDAIQFFSGKDRTHVGFFDEFNAM